MSEHAARDYFSGREYAVAVLGALLVQALLLGLAAVAGHADAGMPLPEEPHEKEVPMAVKPVLDDLPLLKLGGAAPKLPAAWEKHAATPPPAPEAAGLPSSKAPDQVEATPKTPLPKASAAPSEPPPEDAGAPAPASSAAPSEAKAEQPTPSEIPEGTPTDGPVGSVVGPGSPDGSKDGTETDPLKARALDLYRQKLLAWFNARFRPPEGQIPCEELKKLKAGVSARVGADRSVSGFSITRSSGNDIFDEKVRQVMEGTVGQELPPPPPLYPDLDIGSVITPVFSGGNVKCSAAPGSDAPAATPLPKQPAPPDEDD